MVLGPEPWDFAIHDRLGQNLDPHQSLILLGFMAPFFYKNVFGDHLKPIYIIKTQKTRSWTPQGWGSKIGHFGPFWGLWLLWGLGNLEALWSQSMLVMEALTNAT